MENIPQRLVPGEAFLFLVIFFDRNLKILRRLLSRFEYMSEITVQVPEGEQKQFAGDATVADAIAELLSNTSTKLETLVSSG